MYLTAITLGKLELPEKNTGIKVLVPGAVYLTSSTFIKLKLQEKDIKTPVSGAIYLASIKLRKL